MASSKPELFVNEQKQNIREVYEIGQSLGKGSYGEVRTVTHKTNKQKRAGKFIQKEQMDDDEMKDLLNEVNLLKKMNHPNITTLYEFFDERHAFVLVTDLHGGGEVVD